MSVRRRIGPRLGSTVLSGLAVCALGLTAAAQTVQTASPAAQPMPLQARQQMAWNAFHNALQSSCADAHLEDLSPTQLHTRIAVYARHITPADRTNVERQQAASCHNAPGDPNCRNTGFLVAAQQDDYLIRFAQDVCHAGLHCTGPGACAAK